MIEEGYGYLKGQYYQGTTGDAKKSFIKAKRFFFYKKSVVNDAKLGLSEYYLVAHDTLKSVKILNSIIGKTTCKKIERSEFSKLRKTSKNDWDAYYSTRKRISIALNQKDFSRVKNYLTYLKEYVDVTWSCGTGSMGYTKFIGDAELVLKENGY